MSAYTYDNFFAAPSTAARFYLPSQPLPFPFDAALESNWFNDVSVQPASTIPSKRRGSSYYQLGPEVRPNCIRPRRTRTSKGWVVIPRLIPRKPSAASLKREHIVDESDARSKRIRTSYEPFAGPSSSSSASQAPSSPAKKSAKRDINGKRVRKDIALKKQVNSNPCGPPQISYPSSIPETTSVNPYPVTSVPFYPPIQLPSYAHTGPFATSLEEDDQHWHHVDRAANGIFLPEHLYSGTHNNNTYRPNAERLSHSSRTRAYSYVPLPPFTGHTMEESERLRMLQFSFETDVPTAEEPLVSPLDHVYEALPSMPKTPTDLNAPPPCAPTRVVNWQPSAPSTSGASLRCRRMSSVLRQPTRRDSRTRKPPALDLARLPARLWA